MFDLDGFIEDLVTARRDDDPLPAVRQVLERAVSESSGVEAALPPERAEIERLYVSDELTVIKVVWAPEMYLWPHNHNMWACIALYGGGEDNAFYRRAEHGLVGAGGKELRTGDVLPLGEHAIHAVQNPFRSFTGAIHVYGGDFFTRPRSEWDPETFEERPYDVEATLRYFEEQNAKLGEPV